jgi:hypothetical protein
MSTATVPLTISKEAEARVAELGMEEPFRQMLDHIQQTVPGLRAISVVLQEPYDMGGGPCVIFDVTMADPKIGNDSTEMDFGRWKHETFSPEVNQHFVLLRVYG